MPAISRKGDDVQSPTGSGPGCALPLVTHVDDVNSSAVYVNDILVVVSGNKIESHPLPGCVLVDVSTLSTFSPNVFIGGKGVGRIGDAYGNNVIIEGSPNVFAN